MIYSQENSYGPISHRSNVQPFDSIGSFCACDIQKIMAGLYISDQQASKNKKILYDLSVKHIIVVGLQLKPIYSNDFNYLHIPIRDNKKQIISDHFVQTNKFISEAINKKQTVLVHCAKGKSRSVSIILAYLIGNHKMSFQQAFNFMKRKRREASPNEGFVLQLKNYEKNLQQKKIELCPKKI